MFVSVYINSRKEKESSQVVLAPASRPALGHILGSACFSGTFNVEAVRLPFRRQS